MKLLAPLGLALSLIASAAFAAQPVTINNAQNSDSVTVTNHKLDVNATTTVGSFQPSSSGSRMTPLSVTTSDSSGTLPTGAQNIISNTDSTNTIYCNEVGVAATTSDQPIPPKSWFEFTPKAAVTTLHCIAVGGTVTANGLGGSGLATGSGGGGGGGGGGGSVYGPTANGSPAANPPVLLGGTADGSATGNVGNAKVTSDGLVHVSVDAGGGTGGTSSNFGSAFPTPGTAAGVKNGANMVAITEGSATSANSLPVVIASDQGAVPVSQATASNLNATVVGGGGAALATSALQTSVGSTAHTDITALGTTSLVTDSHFTTALGTGSLFSTMAAGASPTNGIGVLGKYLSGGETLTNTQTSALMLDASGFAFSDIGKMYSTAAADGGFATHADATAAIPAGTNLIGNVGIDQTTPGTTNNVTISTNVGTLPLIQATASVPITFTAAGGPTQIIAASGSKVIYITSIHYILSGAGTFALITGTGTNCGTGTTYLEGASGHPLSYVANGGLSLGGGLGPIYVTGAGGEVCAITTGAVDTSGSISYAQF